MMFLNVGFNLLAKTRDSFYKHREKRRWRKLQDMGMFIGKDVYLPMSTWIDTSHCYLISIGDRCRFGPNCVILAHDAMPNEFINAGKIGKVNIKESCSFGFGTIILPGIEIGSRVLSAAGSVISTSIPSDSIVAGNPAKVIAPLQDYLKFQKICLKKYPTFSYMEFGYNLTKIKREQLMEKMTGSIGYIVGGYKHERDMWINPS